MLVRFLSCRERFRLKYVCGLEPHDKWKHTFGYGNIWHCAEEAFAKGVTCGYGKLTWPVEVAKYVQALQRQYPYQREELEKWYNVCRVQFFEYTRYWADHPDVKNRTPLLQEQVFDVPYTLPSGRIVRLRGKWDSVDLITDNVVGTVGTLGQIARVYLQENKTKGDVDREQIERQLKFDLQTMLYSIAFQHADLEQIGLSEKTLPISGISGVRYNVIRRPLSGGKGSIRPHAAKSTKTKFTPAESEQHFYERLRKDYIAKEPDYWFFRIRAEISANDIKVFKDTCLDPLLETVCWWYEDTCGNGKEWQDYGSIRPPMNYRTPFGVYSALEEGGATEYDAYLANGSEAGLRRVETLFPELQ